MFTTFFAVFREADGTIQYDITYKSFNGEKKKKKKRMKLNPVLMNDESRNQSCCLLLHLLAIFFSWEHMLYAGSHNHISTNYLCHVRAFFWHVFASSLQVFSFVYFM